jgi:hypothetical protein
MYNTVFSMSRMVAIAAALALSGSAFAAGQEGQTVVKDQVTGQLRAPSAEEAKEFHDMAAQMRSANASERKAKPGKTPGTVTRQANGSVQAILDDESISYSVMTRNAQGELVLQCVTGATAAAATMSTPSKEHQHDVE